MRFLPSRRAIAIAFVGGVTLAVAAPPGAVLWILAFGLAVGAATRLDARAARETWSAQRDAPERAPQGEPFHVTWNVRARRRPLGGFVLAEGVPDAVEGDTDERSFRLPAGGNARTRLRRVAVRRGVWHLGPGRARVLGPRGLGWLRVEASPGDEVRVDPPVEALRRLTLDTQRSRWLGGATRRLRGVGSEFESLRDYRADDDFRWIDWKASARRRRLTSREYQVDEHQSVVFLFDTGRLMSSEHGERTKLDHALGAALAIGHTVTKRGDNLGLLAFDRDVHGELRPGRGRGHLTRFHEELSRLQPRLVEPDWTAAFTRFQRMVRKRSLVLVFTDLVDERVSADLIAAAARVSRRHLCLVVTLTDTALLDIVGRRPETARDAYEAGVAADALLLRENAIGRLRAAGVRVVDSPADRVAVDAVETYLRLRRENRV